MGRVNPRGLRVLPFVGLVRESVKLCVQVWGGRRIRNSLCGLLNVDSMHVQKS